MNFPKLVWHVRSMKNPSMIQETNATARNDYDQYFCHGVFASALPLIFSYYIDGAYETVHRCTGMYIRGFKNKISLPNFLSNLPNPT